MGTLVLNHPHKQVLANKKKSFQSTFISGVGEEYYIPQTIIGNVKQGDKVIILSDKKGSKERAEGFLNKLVQSSFTKHSPPRPRYDIYIDNLNKVPYHRNDFGDLERSGIAIF